jgi:hypothetical protein
MPVSLDRYGRAVAGRPQPDLGQGFYPRRMVVLLVVPLGTRAHHDRPPKTRPLPGGCSAGATWMKIVLSGRDDVSSWCAATLMERGHQVAIHGGGAIHGLPIKTMRITTAACQAAYS